MVFVDVIGSPAVGRLVEALILDAPAGMAEGDDGRGAGSVDPTGWSPTPNPPLGRGAGRRAGGGKGWSLGCAARAPAGGPGAK